MTSAADAASVAVKLRKADEFLLLAQIASDSQYDAAVSLAVSAVINSADAILIMDMGTHPVESPIVV